MSDDLTVSLPTAGFPDQFAPDSEKKTEAYGLRVGQAIQNEWFGREGGGSQYYDRWAQFHRLRLYARGEQSTQKYKNELAIDGDLSFLNLDWTPVPILPKFVDIVVNGMSGRLFKVKAYAQDAMSSSKRSQFQQNVETQMAGKDVLDLVQKELGVDPFTMDSQDVPTNDEELSLYMQVNYKPAIEIAEEIAINTLLEDNRYSELRKRLDYDQAVLGMSVSKHQFLKGDGVALDYVDPANVVHSYTEDPYFQDVFYWGEVKTIHANECLKINPDLSKEELHEIAKYNQAWSSYHQLSGIDGQGGMYQNDTTTLLYFNYKSTKKFVYKKKKLPNDNSRMIEKDDSFNPPREMMEESGFEKVEKTIDVWYDGIMIAGTTIMLKWELAENMVRPKSATQHVIPNYIACAPRMYKGVIESLVRRCIPFADLIQIAHLKIQQVIAKIVPDGVFIDADGINEVDLGTGGAYTPEDALRLYFQTGSVVGRSFTQDGEFNHARIPVQPLTSSGGAGKMQMLIANYNHYLDMIRSVTGLNEARDGSTPDPNSLVGVQKLAALNSNTATRHILDASLFMLKSMSVAMSYRISDILEYAPFKEEFLNQIGKYNVGILEDMGDLYLCDFGIFIEVAPDEEEKVALEANIQMALSRDNIDIEDAIDIREVKNIKLANQLLKVKRRQKKEEDQQAATMSQQMVTQGNMATQKQAAEGAMMKLQAESQAKIGLENVKIEGEIRVMSHEAAMKEKLMEKEFNYQMQLQGTESQNIENREDKKEANKDKRVDKQNTQQSKMIDQRKNNKAPLNFESNEDTLDGFSLEEFAGG